MRQSWISPRLWCTAHSGARIEHQIRVLSWRALWWYQALFWLESTGYQSRKISVEMSGEEKIWLGATPGQLTLHIKESAIQLPLAFVADAFFHFPGGEIEQASEQTSAPGVSKKRSKRERGWGGKESCHTPTPYSLFCRTRSQLRSLCERFVYVASSDANLLEQKSFNIRKEFNSRSIGLGQQHGRRFIVLKHQYGCRDVIWKQNLDNTNVAGICRITSEQRNRITMKQVALLCRKLNATTTVQTERKQLQP